MAELLNKLNEYIGGKDQSSNKLFTSFNLDSKHISKVRLNREYLISQDVANDLNVYRTWVPFHTFNDAYEMVLNNDKTENLDEGKVGAWGTRSMFNKLGSVLLGTSNPNRDNAAENGIKASEWRLSNNVPLLDSPYNRREIKKLSGCSVKELVQASREGALGRETYDYSDFMYCKYLGKLSNNYLITLRRFPFPVDDFISSLGGVENRKNRAFQTNNSTSIGCMVTWMGTPGNEMSNILKYSVSMPFTVQTADWQEGGASADDSQGLLNGVAAVFDSKYREQYAAGQASAAANSALNMLGFGNGMFRQWFSPGDAPYSARDLQTWRDHNKVYGPVDAIKETYMRSKDGIKFDQTITLVFDYELRSYNGINGRQAMLDLLSNILSVVYTTGTFWGGGYKGVGAHQNNIFTNLQIFRTSGSFGDFCDAFTDDLQTVGSSLKSYFGSFSGKDILKGVGKFLNNFGGMLIGGALNKLGRPARTMVNSLLSPAPVGFWHVTIGNPHHPIMSLGNMVLKNATIEHYGPLGLDDFPTGLKVTCELERGKPRDIRGIEQIYMHGNDRIYTSMGPKVFDMYRHAQDYKGSRTTTPIKMEITKEGKDEIITVDMDNAYKSAEELRGDVNVLKRYFGTDDTYSIYVAAMEQEYGASGKNKKGTAGGDSRQKGTGKK